MTSKFNKMKEQILTLVNQVEIINSANYKYLTGTGETFEDFYNSKINKIIENLSKLGYEKNNSPRTIDYEKLSKIFEFSFEIIQDKSSELTLEYYSKKNNEIIENEQFKIFYKSIFQKVKSLDKELSKIQKKGNLLLAIEKYKDYQKDFLNKYKFFELENIHSTKEVINWEKNFNSYELFVFLNVFIKIINKELNSCEKLLNYCGQIGEREVLKLLSIDFKNTFCKDIKLSNNSSFKNIYINSIDVKNEFTKSYDEYYNKIMYESFKFFDNYFKDLTNIEQQILIIFISFIKPIALFSIYSDKYFQKLDPNSIKGKFHKNSNDKPTFTLKVNTKNYDGAAIKNQLYKFLNKQKKQYIKVDLIKFKKIFEEEPLHIEWYGSVKELIITIYILLEKEIITLNIENNNKIYSSKSSYVTSRIISSGCFFVKKNGEVFRNFSKEKKECIDKYKEGKEPFVKKIINFIDSIPQKSENNYRNFSQYLELPDINENYKDCSYILGKIFQQI